MMYSSTDFDELIETEVCNRLIRLSCAKMVNSKNERGGAKLHRNLLILHLLRRARSEQKRPVNSPMEMVQVPAPESIPEASTVSGVELPALHCNENAEMGAEASGHEVFEQEETSYLELTSSATESSISNCNNAVQFGPDDENGVADMDDGLVQLPFGSDSEESENDVSVEVSDGFEKPALISSSASGNFSQVYDNKSGDYETEQGSSSDSDGESDSCELSPPRQRKRKTSMSRSSSPSTPKKCCVEERQLTGLISVFNSGLSVVADQLLPRSSSSALLQPTSEQLVPSLVRIACNPLIC